MGRRTELGRDALAALAAITLTACGGGGSGTTSTGSASATSSLSAAPMPAPAPPPSPTAEGVYIGTASNLRSIVGIVLDTGAYWFLYSAINNPSVIAGGVQGTGTSQLGSFSSGDAKDFNLEGQGINDATVSASYSAKQSISGVITYTRLPSNIAFQASYQPSFDSTPGLATIAGHYSGTSAVAAGIETTTGTISSTGALTGSGASGCTFSGTITPHGHGNVYDVSVAFGGGVCSNGISTVTGVAFYDTSTRRLYSAAVNSTRTNGFIFTGLQGS
jgi:hypothetical protein